MTKKYRRGNLGWMKNEQLFWQCLCLQRLSSENTIPNGMTGWHG
ncbi:hypothetical protein [Shewanella colwelliana]|nr:hypothetical protein [Shewanella colwelliana]